MDWKDVAKVVAPLAPALGGILGGFIPVPGGALAGQLLGNVIAKAFGVAPTPAAVAGAIASNPNEVVLAKLTAAADEARAMWPAYAQAETAYYEAQAKIAETVNATMRVELQHQHWFFTGWRPAAGWVFVVFAALFGTVLMWAAVRAVTLSPDPLKTISDAWPIFASYFGILAAMVGVYVVGRSNEKVAMATMVPPTQPVIVKAKGK